MACAPPAKRLRNGDTESGLRASILERFFAKYEFSCKHMLSCSDAEAWAMHDMLRVADDECKRLWESCSLGYTESLGDPLLLQEIWRHYRSNVLRELERRSAEPTCSSLYTEQQVLHITTCVPIEGIYVTMVQLLQAGDHVVCMAPAYQALYEIARSKHCVLHTWRPRYDSDSHYWYFDMEDAKAMISTFAPDANGNRVHLRMMIINSPHNPTGACLTQGQFDEIGDLLESLEQDPKPILFSDEMYSDILACRPSAVAKPSSIVLSGLSKPWGMPGLRVGWLLVQSQSHFDSIAAFRDYTTLCLPPHSEILSVVALRNSETFLSRNRDIARKNYTLLQQFCLRNSRWFFPLNQHKHNLLLDAGDFAAVTLFARLRSPLGSCEQEAIPEALTSLPKLTEHLALKHSLCMVAGECFEFSTFPCVRFGTGRANFETALLHLEDALTSLCPA